MQKKKVTSRMFAVLLAVMLTLGLLPTTLAANSEDWQSALNGALDWLIENTPNPSVGNDWEVMTVARAGIAAEDWFDSYLAALETGLDELESWMDFQRVTLTLTALGVDATDFHGHDLMENFRNFIPALERPEHSRGVNANIFALLALDSKPYEDSNRTPFIEAILNAQTPYGSWAFGLWQSIDLTAMAIQALAPYYAENTEVAAAINRGLDWIGDESNWAFGDSAEELAQVIIALTALGRSASSYVDRLLAFRNEETGGFVAAWNNEVNIMSTQQAVLGLVAYYRFNNDMNALFDMRDVGGIVTVTFNPNGGALEIPSTIELALGNTICNLPIAVSRYGYRISGWRTNPDDPNAHWNASRPIIRNITLYANWVRRPDNFHVGDITVDGRITSADATLIARYLAGNFNQSGNTQMCRVAADINGDGIIDSRDLILLARWLMGDNVRHLIAN